MSDRLLELFSVGWADVEGFGALAVTRIIRIHVLAVFDDRDSVERIEGDLDGLRRDDAASGARSLRRPARMEFIPLLREVLPLRFIIKEFFLLIEKI